MAEFYSARSNKTLPPLWTSFALPFTARLGKEKTQQILGNLLNLIALPPKTEHSNKYIEQQFGKIWQAKVKDVSAIADASADIRYYSHMGADKASRATSYDKALKSNSARLAWGAGVWRKINLANQNNNSFKNLILASEQSDNFNYSAPRVDIGLHNLIDADEISSLLAEPFTALMLINRANTIRRDVIKLEPIFNEEAKNNV